MRIGHVVITVNDFDAMVAFYCKTVGLQVSDLGTGAGLANGPRIAFLSADPARQHHELALLDLPHDLGATGVFNHVAFEVEDLDQLREAWRRVANDPRTGGFGGGGPVTAFQGDQWSLRFSDPERNGVEIYSPTPWDVQAAAAPYRRSTNVIFEPFDLTLSDAELADWGSELMDEVGLPYWPAGTRPRSAT